MKITTEPREDHQTKVVAEFETAALEKYKHQAARKIAQKAKVPGFRPGKAPYDVILRLYGEPTIEEDAVELMVEDIYPQMLDEAKINPAAPGTLEDISREGAIKFTFVIPLEPTVNLADYKEIRKEYQPEPVTEKEIDDFIQRLRRSYSTAVPVERKAKVGDLVYVKVNATLVKPAEDEKAEILKDSPLQVVIGENDPDQNDFPYVGFGDNLKGLAANEEKTFKYTYPKDSKFDKLQGKAVEFHVLVETIKELTLPELDEDFIHNFGEFESVEKFKESIKTQLEARHTSEYDESFFETLLDELQKKAEVKYPPQLLDHEMEHVLEAVTKDLADQHMELDAYLKTLKKEKDVWMEEDIKPAARKRLERSLILDEFARLEKLQIKNEEVQAEIGRMLTEMQGSMDVKKLEKQLRSEKVANAITMQAANRVHSNLVFARMKDIATGKADADQAAESVEAKPKTAAKKKTTKPVKSETEPEVKAKTNVSEEKAPAKPRKPKKVVEGGTESADKKE